jgi:2-dehydro-3-deoxygluconokinase
MAYGLDVRADGALDLLALGALVHRLDSGVVPFHKAYECRIHVSGGEFNVAANLADCFGMRTGIATAMVDYPVGDLVAERVRAMGVHPFYRRFDRDGVDGPNVATVYSDRGYGVRPPVVFYNRAHEAAAQLRPGDFDWARILGAGVRWFHSGGIFAALSETTGALIVEGMRAAKGAGAVTSFDLNYRPKLWQTRGGEARAVLGRMVEHADVVFGDLEAGLGIPRPPGMKGTAFGPDVFSGLAEGLIERYPQVRVVATTLREVHSTNRHRWCSLAWIDGRTHVSPTCELDVYDRVGSGDGFAAGLIYGLLAGEPAAEALKLGWAHGALVATSPGDTTMATLEQVRALARGEGAGIRR